MREFYRQRRERLYNVLCEHLGNILDVHAPEAGMRLVGWLPAGKDDRRAAELILNAGVEITSLSRYSLSPLARGGLLFSFGNTSISEQDMLLKIKQLPSVLAQL
jgi:GntR family transcriptional regulator/MocR family aminotransferase